MKPIASFLVDHTKLDIGVHHSRTDGDVVTYDVRMATPNGGRYLSSASLHTIEHIFATAARNGPLGRHIIYVGPMGCRTGFYLLVRDCVSEAEAIALVRQCLTAVAQFEGPLPGATAAQCGNYKEHDLAAAKADVAPLLARLAGVL